MQIGAAVKSKKFGALAVIALVLAFVQVPSGFAHAASKTSTGKLCTIVGQNTNDVLNGTPGNDVICGLGGNDTINGLGGNDIIDGGAGMDVINAGLGDDIVLGGDGADKLRGDAGDDSISGGTGNDIISGGADDDTLRGEVGADSISGDSGVDVESGGVGDDTLSGGDGADLVVGEAGDDTITGGLGTDVLSGNDGNDSITGGLADDRISGESGNDRIFGNAGGDNISGGTGADFASGGDGADSITGGLGNDTLTGDADKDSVDGNQGSNVCDLESQDVALNCLEDTVAPEILDFNIRESGHPIDVSKPNPVVHTTIRIKENFGKIKHAYMAFSSGTGLNERGINLFYACGLNGCEGRYCNLDDVCTSPAPSRLVSGSKFDGVYAFDVDLSKVKYAGIYHFVDGSFMDASGNFSSLSPAVHQKVLSQTFEVIGVPTRPTVESGLPVITSVLVSAAAETGQGQPVTLNITASDSESGVSFGTVIYATTSGTASHKRFAVSFKSAADCQTLEPDKYESDVWALSVAPACLISGDKSNGVYRTTFNLPRGYAFGKYEVESAQVIDEVGNIHFYGGNGDTLVGAGSWTRDSFDYAPTEDFVAPKINSYTWSKTLVNTGTKDEVIFLDLDYSDPSGMRWFWIMITPVGRNVWPIQIITPSNLIEPGTISACSPTNTGMLNTSGSAFRGGCQLSGDQYSGVMRFGFVLPRASAAGKWDIWSTNLGDNIGNSEQVFTGFNNPFTNNPTN